MKNMGRLTGGVTLLAATPWLTFCTPEKHREIAGERARVALIGTGSRGQYHLHNLRAIPHAEVVALCDDYERAHSLRFYRFFSRKRKNH